MKEETKSESFIALAIKFWLPWVLTVIASAIAISQFVASASDYRITYLLESSEKLPSSTPEYSIGLLVNNQTISMRNGLRVQALTIWNSGRETLQESQLREPISVEFVGCSPSALELVGQNNLGKIDTTFDYVPSEIEINKIVVRSRNFDPGEAYKFVFVGSCEADDIRISVVSPLPVKIENQNTAFKFVFPILTFFFALAGAMIIIGFCFVIIDGSKFLRERPLMNNVARFAGVVLGFSLFGLFYLAVFPVLNDVLFWVPLNNFGPV